MLPAARFCLDSSSLQESEALFKVTSYTLLWRLSCEHNSSSGFSILLRGEETLPKSQLQSGSTRSYLNAIFGFRV